MATARKQRPLAAVPDGSSGAPARGTRRTSTSKPKAKTVAQAAADGDELGVLVGMQARVAAAIDDPSTPKRDLAALTRRLMEIRKDIAVLTARSREEAASDAGTGDEDESFDPSTV